MRLAGTRTWRNIFGQVDEEIEQYRTTLMRLRDDFLMLAALTTEVAVLGMQHDVSKIQGDVNKVQGGVSKVQDGVSNIQADVSNLPSSSFSTR
jgi:hypothetical protein